MDCGTRGRSGAGYLIGRDGKLLRRHLGFMVKDQDEYEAAISDALGRKE